MSGINLAGLLKTTVDNMGGLPRDFYYCYASDVSIWPTLPNPDTSTVAMADAQMLVGNLVLKPGKYLKKGYMTPEASELRNEEQGETDGMSYKHVLEIFHPGMKKELGGFMRATNNADLVFIFSDAEGQRYMLGSDLFPARRQSGGNSATGKKAGDRKGASMQFYSYGNGPCPIYPGVLDSDSGSGT